MYGQSFNSLLEKKKTGKRKAQNSKVTKLFGKVFEGH